MDIDVQTVTLDPLSLVTLSRDDKLQLNTENLAKITQTIEDVPLSIISIFGSSSNGKSLLLGYLLKYLYKSDINTDDWMGSSNPDTPLSEIFNWPNGKSPNNPEIWGINPPHILTREDGVQTAILILYTQGPAYNNNDAILHHNFCSLIGLTLAVSSVTIFNVYKTLTESTMTTLADSIKYSLHGTGLSLPTKPKQPELVSTCLYPELVFLIRDWNFSSQFPYGTTGEAGYVKQKILQIDDDRYNKGLKETRAIIGSFFGNIKECLLPYPGDNTIKPSNFQGSLAEMDSIFRDHLFRFIQDVVDTKYPKVRTDPQSKENFTGKTLRNVISAFVGICNTGEEFDLDNYASIHLEPNKNDMKQCIRAAVNEYWNTWTTLVRDDKKILSDSYCQEIDRKSRSKAEEVLEELCNKMWDFSGLSVDAKFKMQDRARKENKRAEEDMQYRCDLVLQDIQTKNGKRRDLFLYSRQQALLTQYKEGMDNVVGYRASLEDFLRESHTLVAELSYEFKDKIKQFCDDSQIRSEVDKLKHLLMEQEEDLKSGLAR